MDVKEKEELLNAFGMAKVYGRIEAKHYNNMTKIMNILGHDGEYGMSLVSIEYMLDELVEAIDEGRLEVRDGKSKVQSVQED